tara:strand:+ start:3587 stop:3835 length:249 start_codon:yes stop_codon:yes gene_type:complete
MSEIVTTRSGRKIKKPTTFQPTETDLVDDYADDDHDTDFDSELDTEDEEEFTSDEDDDEDEMDENGNLKDFVVDDESESEDA